MWTVMLEERHFVVLTNLPLLLNVGCLNLP